MPSPIPLLLPVTSARRPLSCRSIFSPNMSCRKQGGVFKTDYLPPVSPPLSLFWPVTHSGLTKIKLSRPLNEEGKPGEPPPISLCPSSLEKTH